MIASFSGVMAYGKIVQRVDNIEINSETIKNIEGQLLSVEKKLAGTEVSVMEIKEDVRDIKLDIRDIANRI